MSGTLINILVATSAVCAGVSGGVYFAFSAIIMPALHSLPAKEAVPAMQRFNKKAVQLPFMAVFFGGAATSAAVIATELLSAAAQPPDALRLVGAGLSLVAFGITVVRNVPLNNALARLDPDLIDPTKDWQSIERPWRDANVARAAVSIAAAFLLLGAVARPA